ncbi:leucyl-tRNA synthetase [Byssothecium circinans]|uniref:leucine--tRNA ligase n=1 Tax=Byssothecium circinans TaxID=147558 RepID=A0A6A5U9D4_9PLEO|nr:leucyl-tRNA synthetase [Byssothecium circinans]
MRGLSLHCLGWRRALAFPALPPRRWSSTSGQHRQLDLTGLTAKWQAVSDQQKLTKPSQTQGDGIGSEKKKKAYILPMFPYPSGALHLGHLRVYTISDVLARSRQMMGHDVLHPIGWDAFGLPAENAAIERGVHPADWTARNIEVMKKQMMEMGGRWDWDREFRTCDPEFYKHTQHLFLLLHEHGLAYQAESLVNWDPVDQTVLANEQVDANGCSWRSGAKVEKKMLRQWFLRIKEFQKPLLEDLDSLAGQWPERVRAMQKNWIGYSVGTQLRFGMEYTDTEQFDPVDVYTTRADTLLGVQYVALSLNHPIVQSLATKDDNLRSFLDRAKDFPPDSKEGYILPGVQAQNPLSNLIEDNNVAQRVPVFVAPYVLDDYGSGAVMGVPAHDARDYAFWKQNRADEPVRHVIFTEVKDVAVGDRPILEKGFLHSSDPRLSRLSSDQGIEHIVELINQAGGHAKRTENWRLRDWLVSRQRYWGTPIPIIHCKSCGPVPVPKNDLPVELPDLPASYFQGRTGNPLAEDKDWKKTTCPKCHSAAERETDTMDTFMDSSWYFFRFLDPHIHNALVHAQKANQGMPVDVYVGGVEHAILHLLYARFITKFLASILVWPKGVLPNNLGEPFKQLITQGMVHGKTYSDPTTGRFLRPEEVDLSKPSSPVIKSTSVVPKVSYEKMSKSKHNGVNPGTTIATYGADVTRAHMLFQAPVSDILEWDETKITGVQRWLTRVLHLSAAAWFPKKDLDKFQPPAPIDSDLAFILADLVKQGTLKHKNIPALQIDYSRWKRGMITKAILSNKSTYLSILKPMDRALLSKTHEIIASVKQSYTETYALNTVISDLMTLTNAIWDTPQVSDCTPIFKWLATVQLLRLVAPIAPAVAEEGWHILISKTNKRVENMTSHPLRHIRIDSGPSVFDLGFPVSDPELIRFCTQTMTCVVQWDGKRKFEAEILNPVHLTANAGLESQRQSSRSSEKATDELKTWVLGEVMKTEEGKKWMGQGEESGEGGERVGMGAIWKAAGSLDAHPILPGVPKLWNVIVAKGGQIINLVTPKMTPPKPKLESEAEAEVEQVASPPPAKAEETKQELVSSIREEDLDLEFSVDEYGRITTTGGEEEPLEELNKRGDGSEAASKERHEKPNWQLKIERKKQKEREKKRVGPKPHWSGRNSR